MSSDLPLQPWKEVRSQRVGDFRIFTVRSDVKLSPRTGQECDFYVIEAVNWVNVVAVTADDHLIMIDQYRHGSNTVELEIPGGMIDPEDASPLAAGLRELREETGYTGEDGQIIGQVFANPAIMNNTCYTVFVRNCRKTHEIELDHSEDLSLRLVPLAEIPSLLKGGRIKHSLVVAALCHFQLHLGKVG